MVTKATNVQLHLVRPEKVLEAVGTAGDTIEVVEAEMEKITITTQVVHKEAREQT
jgi:hypothetical protein